MTDEIRKFFMTIQDDTGYCAIIQISGFKTQEEADKYIYDNYQAINGEVLTERTTVH
jgi:hypothetical protein